MVSTELALLAGAFLLWAIVVSIPWGIAVYQLAARATAELALARRERDEQLALAEHRAGLLEQAKLLLAEAEADGRSALERREALDAALRDAAPGDRLDAVERLLRAHAERRARREAEARAAAPLGSAADGGAAPRAGATGGGGSARA